MVKKPPVPKRFKLPSAAASKAWEVLKVAASHPASVGLVIMAGSTLLQCAFKKPEIEGSETAKQINQQLGGLYVGAQGVAVACAVSPIVAGAISAVSALIPSPAPAKPEGDVGEISKRG